MIHETRPSHFFVPVVIFIIGGLFVALPGQWDIWDAIGGLVMGSGAVCVWFLAYSAVKKHQLEYLQEIHRHDAEITGLGSAHTKTKVVIDKTPLNGFMHHSFNELSIPPAKLLKFARGIMLEGKQLTIREWTPLRANKLFSRNEWERLISFLEQPDWDDKNIKFAVPINPHNRNEGFELTAAGEKWLRGVLEEAETSVLSPL